MGGSPGGGGTSGGSSGSGAITYPTYVSTPYADFVYDTGGDTVTSSMIALVNTAISANPFTGENAYDPSEPLENMTDSLTDLTTEVSGLAGNTNIVSLETWATILADTLSFIDDTFLSDSYIADDVNAFSGLVNEDLDNNIIPTFKSGMRDIGAVMSSAFIIGEAVIRSSVAKEITKYATGLRVNFNQQRTELLVKLGEDNLKREIAEDELDMKNADLTIKTAFAKVEFQKAIVHYTIEANRIAIVANKEENDQNVALDEMEVKFPLEASMYIGNAIASIAGASTVGGGANAATGGGKSILAGAISGAGTGAAIGGPWGAAIGAGAGALLSMF